MSETIDSNYLNELAESLNRAASAARAMAEDPSFGKSTGPAPKADPPPEPELKKAPPDPYAMPEMENALASQARFKAAFDIASEPGFTVTRENYGKLSDLIHYTNSRGSRMLGANTKGMLAYTVRPRSRQLWPLGDGAGYVPGKGSPEHRELARRTANSRKCYDAAQTLKTESHQRSMRAFLEEGDAEGYEEYVSTWLDFWNTYVECWPKSAYVPEPWTINE